MYLKILPDLCTGCRSCTVYCSLSHEGAVNPDLSRIRVLMNTEETQFVPITCVPCDEKPCIAACPQGALSVNELGAVVIREALCTACGKCAKACGTGAIRIRRIPGRGKSGKAVSIKCDLCGGEPWCVRVCQPGAITLMQESAGGQAVYNHLLAAREELLSGMTPHEQKKLRKVKK